MFRLPSRARVALGLFCMTIAVGLAPATGRAQFDDPFGGGAAPADDPFGGDPFPPAPPQAVGKPDKGNKERPRDEHTVRRFNSSENDILAALDKPVTLEFTKTPLADVAEFLRDLAKINVEIDRRALEDVGIRDDTPITLQVRKISLRSALRLMLRQLDLTYVVRDSTLLITTPEDAQSVLTTTVYPVGKLLKSVDPLVDDSTWASDELIDVITATVRMTTWEEVGGPGSITILRDKLVVSQTLEVQSEVAEFLAMLEDARKIVLAADGQPPKVTSLPKSEGWVGEIEKALAKKADCDFIDTPLKDVAQFLADAYAVNILIDTRALDDVGIGTDTPVTLQVKGVSLGAALRLLLKEIDCVYVVRDEVLMITTPEEAESELQTRVFPVHDLVFPADDDFVTSLYFGAGGADYDSLIDLITSTVRPSTWEEVGGPGAIEDYNGCLVFSQTRDVFEVVETLLAGIRDLKAQYAADAERILTKSVVLDEIFVPNLAKLREALDGEVGMLAFKNTPLNDVVKALADKHSVPILIDRRALEDVGVGQDTPITATLGGESLSEAMRRILKELDLTWNIRDEVIMITTPEETESELLTRIYPVRDLVLPRDSDSLEAEIAGQADYDSLIDTLTRTVRPTMWQEVGGPGAAEEYPACFGLVISQTEDVHEEIEELLAQIRKTDEAKADAAAEVGADSDGEGAKPQAVDGAILKDKAGERLHLKVYRLSTRDREDAVELAEVVRELVQPNSWRSDEAYYIKPLAGSIIVRHTAATHRKIHRLLTELDAVAWPSFGGFTGGGSAFGVDQGFNGNTPVGGSGNWGGGLNGGVFDVPDHVHGQFLSGSIAPALGYAPYRPLTTIAALSLPAQDDRAAMPLAVYNLQNIADDEAGRELAEAIEELIAREAWQSESGAYLRPVGRKLIVRHEGAVHRRVYRLLLELGAIYRPVKQQYWGCGSVIPVVGERQSPKLRK